MRFMTTGTALQANRSMFERERAALIAVTLEATWFVGGNRLHRARQKTSMRVVAIHARHRTFGQLVFMRSPKRRPDRGMARCAGGIDGGGLSRKQRLAGLVDGMAGHAT